MQLKQALDELEPWANYILELTIKLEPKVALRASETGRTRKELFGTLRTKKFDATFFEMTFG